MTLIRPLTRSYSLILLLLLWEGMARLGLVHPVYLPSFTESILQLFRWLIQGVLLVHASATLLRAFAGLSIAVVTGIVAGVAMGRSPIFEDLANPLIGSLYPMPKIALFPVMIFWLGIGHLPKIMVIAISCFFPMVINTYTGAKNMDNRLLWSAWSMGVRTRTEMLRRVIIPAVTPSIFNGLRISVPVSFILSLATEMVMGREGLGFLVIISERKFESPSVFAGIITISLIGLAFNHAITLLQHRLLRWHEKMGGP